MNQSGIHLQGAKELKKIMEALGPEIALRAGVIGVRKAALVMKNDLKRSSPKITGKLRSQWMIKKLKSQRRAPSAAYAVRLRNLHYYELLEFTGKDGGAYNPFAARSMKRTRQKAAALIISGTRTALAQEAGKAYAKSKRVSK